MRHITLHDKCLILRGASEQPLFSCNLRLHRIWMPEMNSSTATALFVASCKNGFLNSPMGSAGFPKLKTASAIGMWSIIGRRRAPMMRDAPPIMVTGGWPLTGATLESAGMWEIARRAHSSHCVKDAHARVQMAICATNSHYYLIRPMMMTQIFSFLTSWVMRYQHPMSRIHGSWPESPIQWSDASSIILHLLIEERQSGANAGARSRHILPS